MTATEESHRNVFVAVAPESKIKCRCVEWCVCFALLTGEGEERLRARRYSIRVGKGKIPLLRDTSRWLDGGESGSLGGKESNFRFLGTTHAFLEKVWGTFLSLREVVCSGPVGRYGVVP